MFPLFHMAGWSMTLNAWQTRQRCTSRSHPTRDTLLSTAERHRATRLYHIPAVWQRVLEHDRRVVRPLVGARVRHRDVGDTAGAPRRDQGRVPRHGHTDLLRHRPRPGRRTMLADADIARKPGRSGRRRPASPCGSSRRRGLRAQPVPHGRVLRAPGGHRRGARSDGWYHTGDLGALDDEGYLSIVGRARDVLRTGGETVAPTEVEAVLADAPGRRRGRGRRASPTSSGARSSRAVVVAAPGAPAPDARRAARTLRRAGSRAFKQPRRVEQVDGAPPHRRDRPDPAHAAGRAAPRGS